MAHLAGAAPGWQGLHFSKFLTLSLLIFIAAMECARYYGEQGNAYAAGSSTVPLERSSQLSAADIVESLSGGAGQPPGAAGQDTNSSGGGSGGVQSDRCEPSGIAAASWRASLHVAATDYQPSLPERFLQKGIVTMGAAGGLARARLAVAKLLAGQPISMGYIGGSVTQGSGASAYNLAYVPLTFKWINDTFPGATHRLVNGAYSAVNSAYFCLCANWHLPPDVDLVFVELNINDHMGFGDSPIRRAHERLLRKLLHYERRPAVVELVHMRRVREESPAAPPFLYLGDDIIGALAQFYHLPWLSTRSLLYDVSGDTGPPPRPELAWDAWMSKDNTHPTDLGHQYLADLVIAWLHRMLDEVASNPPGPLDQEEVATELPAPMFKGNHASQHNTCLMRDQFKPVVTFHDDAWEWVDEGKTAFAQKWGYTSTTIGSKLEITLNTNVVPDSKNVTLGIAHLYSYEHMGQFEVACVQGCTCTPMVVDGHSKEDKTSTMVTASLIVTSADSCKLRVTVLPETNSGEHKVKVMGVVVSETSDGFLVAHNEKMTAWGAHGMEYESPSTKPVPPV